MRFSTPRADRGSLGVLAAPLVGLNSPRCQREAELRFALVRANQQAEIIARVRDEEDEKRRLGLALGKVQAVVRQIVDATAKLTWITAGYGWISIVAPIVIASPAYFSGRCTFGGPMVVVGAFYQVNQALRWFVDNFALLAEWRAALFRVISLNSAVNRRLRPFNLVISSIIRGGTILAQ